MNKKIIASALVAGILLSMPVSGFAAPQDNTTTQESSSVSRYQVMILGDRDEGDDDYITKLQTWLKYYGHLSEEPTGYFGENTQKAVIEFQEKHATNVDGKAGPITQKILYGENYTEIPSSRKVTNALGSSIGEYSLGDRGQEIERIQTRLKELGYYTYSRITEYYGPITEDAVLKFKKNNGLSTDNSVIDAKVYNTLFSDSAKKAETQTTATTAKSTTTATTAKSNTSTTAKSTTTTTAKSTKSTTTSSTSSTQNSSKIESLIATAMAQQGKPYVYGSSGPNSFDCSGFTSYALKSVGISGPRTSAAQSTYSSWEKVSYSQLKRGDLVFFASPNNSNVGHCGIYLGGGQFIHASSGSKKQVIISSLSSGYYKTNFRWGRRVA